MNTHLTTAQLERMTTHELADLLANIVILLKRLPDIEYKQLVQTSGGAEQEALHILPALAESPIISEKQYTHAELEAKKSPELREIAKGLQLTFNGKTNKKELVSKILARQEQGFSDQFALQHL